MNWSKVADFYSINVKENCISKKASMLTARTTHQIAVINNLIYVLGGFDDAGNGILSIEAYNIDKDQWSVVTSIPGVLSKTWPQSLGILSDRFYISVFTTPNTFKIMQKGYFYDLNTNVWTEAPVINERARYCPTSCLVFPRNVYSFNNESTICLNHELKSPISTIKSSKILSETNKSPCNIRDNEDFSRVFLNHFNMCLNRSIIKDKDEASTLDANSSSQ